MKIKGSIHWLDKMVENKLRRLNYLPRQSHGSNYLTRFKVVWLKLPLIGLGLGHLIGFGFGLVNLGLGRFSVWTFQFEVWFLEIQRWILECRRWNCTPDV